MANVELPTAQESTIVPCVLDNMQEHYAPSPPNSLALFSPSITFDEVAYLVLECGRNS